MPAAGQTEGKYTGESGMRDDITAGNAMHDVGGVGRLGATGKRDGLPLDRLPPSENAEPDRGLAEEFLEKTGATL